MSEQPPAWRWQAFAVPKGSHRPEEYEDAAAADGDAGRFAVADGAAESAFAGPWARLLTAAFVAEPAADWADWLPAVRRRWLAEAPAEPLPWYLEAKLEEGAFATFLGVELRKPEGQRTEDRGQNEGGGSDCPLSSVLCPSIIEWHALAVGDSCLFHLRGGELLRAFPVERSADFGLQPSLVPSRNGRFGGPPSVPYRAHGSAEAGDRLLLMTDALARWFLERHEAGGPPGELPEGPDEFALWVEGLREAQGLRDDDVTLIVIEL
jgi:hypothetical protein